MCTLEPAIGFLEYRPCPLTWRIRYTSHSHGYLPERNWSQEQRSASSKAKATRRSYDRERNHPTRGKNRKNRYQLHAKM